MTSINVESIKNHADVIASCGTKVGEVDHLVGADQIKLTKHGDGHHHLIPTSWVGVIYAELSGDFPLGNSRQPTYKSLRPFDLVS